MPARISFYRPTGQSRRQTRQAHDHDVFEGLPVRRWSREWVSVSKPNANSSTPQPELPLPKDAHLLSTTSQGLLAAARAGSNSDETPKPREPATAESLFRIKRWVRIPKDAEPPEPVYLAKVPDVPGKKGEDVVAMSAGDGAVTVMPRRRAPPPPKKKNKRPGRKPGFRKTVTFEQPQDQQQVAALQAPSPPPPLPAQLNPEEQQQPSQLQGSDSQQAASVEVEMMDVDAASKEDLPSVNPVATEIERAEKAEETTAVAKKDESEMPISQAQDQDHQVVSAVEEAPKSD